MCVVVVVGERMGGMGQEAIPSMIFCLFFPCRHTHTHTTQHSTMPYLPRLQKRRGVASIGPYGDRRGGGQPTEVLAAKQPDEAVFAPAPPPAVLGDPKVLPRRFGGAVADPVVT